jgi:hypothetical protein
MTDKKVGAILSVEESEKLKKAVAAELEKEDNDEEFRRAIGDCETGVEDSGS